MTFKLQNAFFLIYLFVITEKPLAFGTQNEIENTTLI